MAAAHERPCRRSEEIDEVVRILLRKLSDDKHVLEIVRDDGRSESRECETRSFLVHDLLHYAVETEARLDGGLWGHLAAGRSLAQMNDRTEPAPAMAMVEQIVALMSASLKGRSAEEIIAGFRYNADALDWSVPDWLLPSFVSAVQERMRRLLGRWRATPFGAALELPWPA